MVKIGNIVSNKKTKDFGDLFNIVSDYSLIDNELPTLIIGYKKAGELIENYSILKKTYNDGMLQWTFSRTEQRNEYIQDIEAFKEFCIMRSVKNVKYIYIDFINYGYNKVKKVIEYLNSKDKKICFLTRNADFIFIYSEKYNVVWGLSLTLCEYIGINKHKIIKRLKDNINNIFIKNSGIISEDIRKRIGENIHYLLPIYLYFS